MPLYIKKFYKDDPHFADAKVVYSAYKKTYDGSLDTKLIDKLKFDGFEDQDIEYLKDPNALNLEKVAIANADALIEGSEELNEELTTTMRDSDKPMLTYCDPSTYVKSYSDFYDEILEENTVLAE